MTFSLNRFRIKSRIYVGFAALIALTVMLALFSTLQVMSAQRQVAELLRLSDRTKSIVEAGRLVETLTRASLTYKMTEDDAAARLIEDTSAQERDLVDAASKETLSNEQHQAYRSVRDDMDTLAPRFRTLVTLGSSDKAARARLYSGGDELTSDTQRLIDTITHSGEAGLADQASRFESAMLLVRVSNWRFLATRDPKGPAIFNSNWETAEKALAQLQENAHGVSVRSIIQNISAELAAYRESFEQISSGMLQVDEEYATDIAPALARMQRQLDAARLSLTHQMSDVERNTSHKISNTLLLQVIVGIALLALGIVLAFAIAASIVKPLSEMTMAMIRLASGDTDTAVPSRDGHDEIVEMAHAIQIFKDNELARRELEAKIATGAISNTQQIAATAKQQQASASEVAATVTEIGAASKEISATSRELVRTMGEVALVAEQSATLANSGREGLGHMESTMRNVMEAASAINAKLAVLNEKAGNINQVVVTITKVADQTNLLSLNAAIEAEKAGEYGRGFSVVATEIRRLADQTAVATYDIEQMVKEIQSAVAAGVMGMDKFSEEVRRGMQEVQQVGGQLAQIIEQVQALAPRVEAVNEGMQAQSTGAEQITQALTQLTEATQRTVESLRHSTVAIEELNKVSSGLRNGILRASSATHRSDGRRGISAPDGSPAERPAAQS